MGTKFNEEDLRLYKAINEILYNDWNPIGVNDLPKDEYQKVLPSIYNLKKADADIEVLTQCLMEHERHILGSTGDIDRCRNVAQKIMSL